MITVPQALICVALAFVLGFILCAIINQARVSDLEEEIERMRDTEI